MRKMMTIGMLVLSMGVASGCGDSVQNNMERAEIAMNHSKYDNALELSEKVLEVEPQNIKAARIKAVSLLQLGRLEAAFNAISSLLKQHPEDVELHEMMVRWGVTHNQQLVNNSALIRVEAGRIAINNDMVSQIDRARQVVEEQAMWLGNEGKKPADAEYARAQLADLKIRMFERHLNLLQNTMARTDEDRQSRGQEIEAVEADINRGMEELQSRLASTLASDPAHRNAALRYNSVLVTRKQWAPLWDFLKQSSAQTDLQESLVSQMVLSLLEIPPDERTIAERLELGWQLTEAVPAQRRKSVDWWLANARLHMLAGQYDKAVTLLEQVRSTAPQNNDASYLLASCFFHQNQFAKAQTILKDLSVKLNRSASVALLYGMTLRELGDNGAREALRHAIELAPDSAMAREQMILLTSQSGDTSVAMDDLQKLYDQDPTNPRAIRFMLQFLRAKGETQKVSQLLANVEQISPRQDEYLAILVDGYMYLQQIKQAEQTAREWVSRSSSKLDSNMALARILLIENQEEEARTLISSLKDKFPQEQNLKELIGTLYLQQRSYDRAIELFNEVLEQTPTNNAVRLKLALAQFNLVLTDDAVENVEKVIEEDPTNTEALSLAARIYQSQGKNQLASETLARIDTDNVDIRRSPLLAAQLKARAERYDEAINIATQAIFAGNDDPALRMLVAAVNIKIGNLAEAENQLLSLARSQPDNWLAYSALSSFYSQNNMTSKGVSYLSSLEGGNQLYARMAIASLLSRNDEHAQALDQIKDFLKPMVQRRDPRAITVASVISSLHLALKDPVKAKATFQQLIDARLNVPQATLAQIDLDLAAWKKGDDTTALRSRLESLLKTLPPEERGLAFQIVRRLTSLEEYDSALKIVDGWTAQSPDNVAMDVVKGGILLQAGRNSEAAVLYAAAARKNPENAQLWLRLGQAHARGYEFPQAEEAYRTLAKLGTGARAAALTELGQLYTALGLNAPATGAFEELDREGNLRDPRVIYAMGVAAQSIGKDEIALKRFAEVPKASSLYGSAQIRIAQIDQAQGKIDEARKRLSELARDRDSASAAAQELVNLSLRDKNNEQLLRWTNQMLSLDALPVEQRKAWLNLRAVLAMNHRDWTGAAAALDQIAQMGDDSPNIAAMRVLVSLQKNQMEAAKNIYRANRKLQGSAVGASLAILMDLPIDPTVTALPAMVEYFKALRNGDVAAAKAAAVKIPSQPMLYQSDLMAVTNRPDTAIPEFKAAMSNLLAAELAMALNMNEMAAQICEGVITNYHSMGLVQSMYAKTQVAINNANVDMWTKMNQQVPSTAAGTMATSQLQVLNKDFAGATASIQKLLAEEPGNEFVEYRLAGVLIQAQKPTEAIKLLEQIVAKGGRFSVVAGNDLAYLLAVHQPQRLDEARKLAQNAEAAMPNNAALLDTIGWINHLGKNDKEALPLLVRASTVMKDSAEVHYHLGVVYAANGQKQWAKYHLEAAKNLTGNTELKGLKEALDAVK